MDPSQDVIARDDIFARTNGPDKPGSVRMLGLGVTLTDVFEVNCSVVLLSVTDPSKIVAKGYLRGMDISTIVGGEELGKNWCSVHIIVGMERDERLAQSSFVLQTIGEANRAIFAWPCNLVCLNYLLLNFCNSFLSIILHFC
ncbi:hypothetical protein CDL12_15059 [Handroanthus impetiginosus]|uniref:Transposase Tnp1/En/Spm-like domain-containing protein n=1 Tax=Handroanthus impetiginosus TaxID=429701 RepID=A0A2G9H487_9LAMI|nr:hypothetical protein CDL12_15059 [Handroanthus impetiginosus]